MEIKETAVNPISANPTKWSNTLKQFVGNSQTICFSVFDHFVEVFFIVTFTLHLNAENLQSPGNLN